ncbi:hypothetical protein RHMOL_Rhmol11G0255800 [Rhododendron molle]|uniref:Uncharacterized protein n=1 Tax=Rhododendron molle TaxID=49168 RepID=A0ACC0LX44_RHOML|nr:hypothetical protein RHMOL_Rhmol11G0255800 [Rhododendron molle]
MGFPLLIIALSTSLDIWCQIVVRFLISSIIELAICAASIVQVCEEDRTSGTRESGSIAKKEQDLERFYEENSSDFYYHTYKAW